MTVLKLDYSAGYMQNSSNPKEGDRTGHWTTDLNMSIGEHSCAAGSTSMAAKRPGKRPGRKPSKIDQGAKLERSRQSARECRARKKLRYQYLEELVLTREKAVFALRDELETYKQWCFQLEGGGPVPESLLKMIASENVSARAREIKQVSRSLLQQQRHQQQFQISSSSSNSSTSLEMSPSSYQHQQQSHHVSAPQPQGSVTSSSHVSQLHGGTSNNSPLRNQHQVQQLPHQHLQQQKQPSSNPLQQKQPSSNPLHRQLAFDHTHPQDLYPRPTPLRNNQEVTPAVTSTTQGFVCPHKAPTSQLQQLLLPSHQYQQSHVNNILLSQQSYSLPETGATSASLQPFLSRVKSEPPAKYDKFLDMFKTFPNATRNHSKPSSGISLQESGDSIRRRSLSNPATMTSFTKPNVHVTSDNEMPSPLQEFITSHSSPGPSHLQSDLGLGLFTGSAIGTNMHSSSVNMMNPITIEDNSSSSDENMNEQMLFQSSLNSQKRTMSAPFLSENSKRPMLDTRTMTLTPASLNYDPHTRLLNLTNVNCSDLTKTSNTSSPSSYGLPPSPTPSLRYSGLFSYTPSSSATTSPAPLSSLSSVLEFSDPSSSTSSLGTISELPTVSLTEQFSVQTNSLPIQSLTSDHLPDWYSFLADLEDGAMSSGTSRHGAPSIQGTPKAHEQPLTPDPSFMNVPNIIDEILDSDNQLL